MLQAAHYPTPRSAPFLIVDCSRPLGGRPTSDYPAVELDPIIAALLGSSLSASSVSRLVYIDQARKFQNIQARRWRPNRAFAM